VPHIFDLLLKLCTKKYTCIGELVGLRALTGLFLVTLFWMGNILVGCVYDKASTLSGLICANGVDALHIGLVWFLKLKPLHGDIL
jgi:hypothetical protein